MARIQFTVTIEKKVLERYRKHCRDNDINMSKRIERHMKKEMKENGGN